MERTVMMGRGLDRRCASTICVEWPEYLRELGVERQGDVKEKKVRWGVVISVCQILIVLSVLCELPKPEAADDHLFEGWRRYDELRGVMRSIQVHDGGYQLNTQCTLTSKGK